MRSFVGFVALIMLASIMPAQGQLRLTSTLPHTSPVYLPVKSFIDMRYGGVIRQTEDLSCGAAALATLLQFHFDLTISERDIINDIFENVSEKQRDNINQYGFSLLELKQAGERKGLLGGGFRLDGVESLEKLKAPVIALTTVRGYAHFVVIRAAKDGKVFVADPAFGNRTQNTIEFSKEWDGVVLALVDADSELQNTVFMRDYALYGRMNTLISLWNQTSVSITPSGNEF